MGEIIIDNILIHAGDDHTDDSRKAFSFLPCVMLSYDRETKIRVFRKCENCLFYENIAVAKPLIF